MKEAQNEAACTKEELNSCKESLEKLQELLQVGHSYPLKNKRIKMNVFNFHN